MAAGDTPGDGNEAQPDVTKVPVWLTLQRCRGLGWLHAGHGGCLGLGDSGRGAAVFSRVVLVPPEDVHEHSAAATAVGSGGGVGVSARTSSVAVARRRGAGSNIALRVLDNVAPVEVEAAAGEAAEEGGYGDSGDLFAALLSPSVPTESEAADAKIVQGDFVVMHRVQEEPPPGEEDVEELHLCFGRDQLRHRPSERFNTHDHGSSCCFGIRASLLSAVRAVAGELLWHPAPPRLFACRSLWTAPQRMRLTKSTEKQKYDPTSAETIASPAGAGSNLVLVLSDVEEAPAGEQDLPCKSQSVLFAA